MVHVVFQIVSEASNIEFERLYSIHMKRRLNVRFQSSLVGAHLDVVLDNGEYDPRATCTVMLEQKVQP